MKSFVLALVVALLIPTLLHAQEQPKESTTGKLWNLFKKVQASPTSTSVGEVLLSNDEIRKGLTEALTQGMRTAVASLGREDGFFKNALVKIPVPENLKEVEKGLRLMRQDKMVDDFVQKMNRAAEKATPSVGEVLADVILKLTIDDCKSILNGPPDAATQYFKKSSNDTLFKRVLPIVKDFTDSQGATKQYKKVVSKAGGVLSLLGKEEDFDLDKYVTNKALDGLYVMIAAEEKRIRENPSARLTDVLQKVFGSVKK